MTLADWLAFEDAEPLRYQTPCPCEDCAMFEPTGCPLPAEGIPSQPCVYAVPDLNCQCIALVSQGYCEGCYVATK